MTAEPMTTGADDASIVLKGLSYLAISCRHVPEPLPGDPRADCCAKGRQASDRCEAIAALARLTGRPVAGR